MAEPKKRRSAQPPGEEPAAPLDAAANVPAPPEAPPAAPAGDPAPEAMREAAARAPSPAADAFFAETLHSTTETIRLIERLTDVAAPGVIFGAPVTVGDQVILTASEVMIGLGAGFGSGSGSNPDNPDASGTGSGGGGGGSSFGRPVAVISVGPQGVKVEPVVDATKIAITFFTAFVAMFLALRSMRRFGKE